MSPVNICNTSMLKCPDTSSLSVLKYMNTGHQFRYVLRTVRHWCRSVMGQTVSGPKCMYTDRLTTIDMGRKVGSCCAPFLGEADILIYSNVAWAEACLQTKWHPDLSNSWPQYTNVTRQAHRQTKTPFTRCNLLSNRLSNRFDNRLYRVNGV